jgi:hypothetical protein
VGTGFLRRLTRAFERARDGETLTSWSPSSLDPYGLVPLFDAWDEAEHRAAIEKVVVLPRSAPEIEEHERTTA